MQCLAIVSKEFELQYIQYFFSNTLPLTEQHVLLEEKSEEAAALRQRRKQHQEEEFTEKQLSFQHVIHASLDVVESQLASLLKRKKQSDVTNTAAAAAAVSTPQQNIKCYLGAVHFTEDCTVYAYASNTDALFFAMALASVDEQHISPWFSEIHQLYADRVTNPFFPLHIPLKSPSFEAAIETATNRRFPQ